VALNPKYLHHETFGRLTWDEAAGNFSGRVVLVGGDTIDLLVDPFSDHIPRRRPSAVTNPPLLADAVAQRVRTLVARLEHFKAYAAEHLLPVYNDGDWCEGTPIDLATLHPA
jgi:hypothetical protein